MQNLSKALSIPILAAAIALATVGASPAEPEAAFFGNDPFIGEISIFAGNFAPRGWATCEGQLLAIAQNQALFSILGTTYGGDGRSTFALPDLRGRAAIHAGAGPGLKPVVLGQKVGAESAFIGLNQMPSHTHNLNAFSGNGQNNSPAGDVLATGTTRQFSPNAPDVAMNGASISPAGGNAPISLMQPSLGLNYIIALQGTYPSRN